MRKLGIDLGASAVKLALLNEEGTLLKWVYRLHRRSPLPVLEKLLSEIYAEWLPSENVCVLACGIESGLFDLPVVGDIIALTEGAKQIAPPRYRCDCNRRSKRAIHYRAE